MWCGVLLDIWWFSCHSNAPRCPDMKLKAFSARALPPRYPIQINRWGYKRLAVKSLPVNPASAVKYPRATEVDPNERFYTEIMAASVWDFKLSLSHTACGSDAEQAGGIIRDLNIISSISVFLVLALAGLWKRLPKSQAVFMIGGNVCNALVSTHFVYKLFSFRVA